jgi:D-glycero-alpha-D-manno-heptose-7-phosphate kinase
VTTEIRASAPLRISFVGGGTDFPHYFERHGGAVLSATIDHAAHVRVQPRTDRQVRIRSLDLGHLVEYHLERGPVYDGVMDLPKAAIERLSVPTGVDVDIASDAPPGSGLGGSSALVTACVGALAMLLDRTMTPREVAAFSYAIEREDLGIAGAGRTSTPPRSGDSTCSSSARGASRCTRSICRLRRSQSSGRT